MTSPLLFATAWALALVCCAAAGYQAFAALSTFKAAKARRVTPVGPVPGAVSVLKPLCGAEPRLFENLATFCEQSYPEMQLVFGVSASDDPAIAVVERLRSAYPRQDIALVVDSTVHGQNLKVSNLINMAAQARHDLLVIADSDIAVEPDYLTRVLAPLADPAIGIVTCLYRAQAVGGLWPRLGALFVNQWFAPSVRVAHAGGSTDFGFGATLALRRATLERIGGLAALRDELADDYWLAEHVRRLGLRTVLSDVMVSTDVVEPDFGTLWARETRWLRTIRSINPGGYAFLFITFASPWLLMAAWLGYGWAAAVPLGWPARLAAGSLWLGLAARLAVHALGSRSARHFWHDLALVPARDALLALDWLIALFGSHVRWRSAQMRVNSHTNTLEITDGA
ncbi:glycosyl transferase [Pandoraea thiooxydans]|uniref:Glycosyl transferase n=1 Tax=Pandoraea thiooxydans TaxID=445709 RepID=A0A0G3EQ23_9BURK|nr:bacteriohopanetetrol glucosamine biosynthesis glycosyltransferase HpnI [Pandoraea thiooxydans]AKJ68129.1 hypothetical protein ABW99_07795 [Pandoraea thiooxydans]APR95400.1 glycosyl transferase [Pandoraea thiooxydans]